MDAGKVGQLPEALWDALLSARALSAPAGGAADDNGTLPPNGAPPSPPAAGVKVDLGAVSRSPVLPPGGYTVSLSPAAVIASRTPAPPARNPMPVVEDGTTAEAMPRREAPPVASAQAERQSQRIEQSLAAVSGAPARPETARPASTGATPNAGVLDTSVRPESMPRGLPPETLRQSIPAAFASPLPTPMQLPIADAPRSAATPAPPTAGEPAVTQAQAPPASPASAPLAAPVAERTAPGTDSAPFVASTVTARPSAAPEIPLPALPIPAPPAAGPRTDVPPAYIPAGAYVAAAHLAASAEEAKAASRLSHRPAPELVQQLLISHEAPRPPAPELYRLVVAAVVLGILLYLVL